MIPATVEAVLQEPTPENIEDLLSDWESVFAVDWREEDEAIAEYCEGILQTGQLTAEIVDIDHEPGFELYVSFRDRRIKVPLVIGIADRHITLHTLNKVLAPDFEIRFCRDSDGADTIILIPLSTADWKDLETRYGEKLNPRFQKIEEHPNLFTEQ